MRSTWTASRPVRPERRGGHGPAALVACSEATAVPPIAAHARGFNSAQQVGWSDADLTTSFNEMAYTRSRLHRLNVNWWDVQPEHLKDAPPAQWQWGDLDRVVAAGRNRRFTLVLTPTGSPNWARFAHRRIPDEPSRKFRKFGYPDEPWHGYWDRFIHALADRYRNDVYALEIWNEQNSRPFWDPSGATDPNPALYRTSSVARRPPPEQRSRGLSSGSAGSRPGEVRGGTGSASASGTRASMSPGRSARGSEAAHRASSAFTRTCSSRSAFRPATIRSCATRLGCVSCGR